MEPGVQRTGAYDVRGDSRKGSGTKARSETSGIAAEAAGEKSRAVAAEESPAPHVLETAVREDASRFCPVCSQRLESRRCKLICHACGYYMSCADYY